MPGDTTTTRWRRYGHDRLFVDHQGRRVGWRDLLTEEDHLEDDAHEAAYRAAVDGWLLQQRRPEPGLDTGHTCRDLAENPPAAATSLQAQALRAERERKQAEHAREIDHRVQTMRVQAAAAEAEFRRRHPIRARLRRVFGVNPLEDEIAIEVERMHADGPEVSAEERAWSLGASGELAVAEILAGLPAGWHLLHAIPVGDRGSDIDHLLIGPAGVFCINTKHHPGKQVWVAGRSFMVSGRSTPYLPKAHREGERVTRSLAARTGWSIPASPLIVVVGASKVQIKEQPSDVTVLAMADLRAWLAEQPHLLDPDHVQRVFAAARECLTWHDR